MAYTIAQLRALSDDELIAEHDADVENVVVGVQCFLDEIRRREAGRAEAAAYELGRRAYWLSVMSAALAAVSAVAAVVAIVIASFAGTPGGHAPEDTSNSTPGLDFSGPGARMTIAGRSVEIIGDLRKTPVTGIDCLVDSSTVQLKGFVPKTTNMFNVKFPANEPSKVLEFVVNITNPLGGPSTGILSAADVHAESTKTDNGYTVTGTGPLNDGSGGTYVSTFEVEINCP